MAFFVEVAVVFVGIALKDRTYMILQNHMLTSMSSTNEGVLKTYDVIQQSVST